MLQRCAEKQGGESSEIDEAGPLLALPADLLFPDLGEGRAEMDVWTAEDQALGPNMPIEFQFELDDHWAFGEAEGDSPLLALVKSSFVSLENQSALSDDENDLLGIAGGLPMEHFWSDLDDPDSEPRPSKPPPLRQ